MDDKEYIRIFHLFKADVFRLAFSYTKNRYDAEDITQNVFVKLYNYNNQFNGDSHIKKWLIKVAVNECKTMLLSPWRKRISSLTEKEQNIGFSSSEKSELFYAVVSLPKKYRLVVHLYYYEDYSIKEISQILKLKETTIQTQLSRAREKLNKILKEE
jgi:RNA polymerase sigma-70 factor (ECF subfamily)